MPIANDWKAYPAKWSCIWNNEEFEIPEKKLAGSNCTVYISSHIVQKAIISTQWRQMCFIPCKSFIGLHEPSSWNEISLQFAAASKISLNNLQGQKPSLLAPKVRNYPSVWWMRSLRFAQQLSDSWWFRFQAVSTYSETWLIPSPRGHKNLAILTGWLQ